MLQLSGLDASFLYMEGPTMFGHVGSLYFLDPSTATEPLTFDRIRANIIERLPLVPLYRRRIVEMPYGLDHPYWIEDPNFDVDNHLHHIALPAPGTDQQLAKLISGLCASHLDRSRPLWELWVIEGHESGHLAHYSKVHHAAIDGVSGAELLTASFDIDPDPSKKSVPANDWTPEPLPTDAQMLTRGWATLSTQPLRFANFQAQAMKAMAGHAPQSPTEAAREGIERPRANLLEARHRAPTTSLNTLVSAGRSWGFGSLSLDNVKEIKNRFGVTVNDVVMALCGGALRRWLEERSELPEESLTAMLPVSTRSASDKNALGNRISAMIAALGTDIIDPVERLRAVNRSTKRAKEQHHAIPAHLITDAAQFSSPALAAQAAQLAASMPAANAVEPSFNVTVSNVPGSPVELWSSGARLVGLYPVSTIMDRHGVGFTVQSYISKLDVGVIADRKMVPDAQVLVEYLRDELVILTERARKED